MVDEPGNRSAGGQHAPDFLTVKQTADVLQLGRSTTYELVRRYVETDGAEGIPAIVLGGQYRVPRARLEELAGRPIAWPPASRERKPRGQQPTPGQTDDEAFAADAVQVELHDAATAARPADGVDVGGHEATEEKGRLRGIRPIRLLAELTTVELADDADAIAEQSLLESDDSGQPSLPFAG